MNGGYDVDFKGVLKCIVSCSIMGVYNFNLGGGKVKSPILFLFYCVSLELQAENVWVLIVVTCWVPLEYVL